MAFKGEAIIHFGLRRATEADAVQKQRSAEVRDSRAQHGDPCKKTLQRKIKSTRLGIGLTLGIGMAARNRSGDLKVLPQLGEVTQTHILAVLSRRTIMGLEIGVMAPEARTMKTIGGQTRTRQRTKGGLAIVLGLLHQRNRFLIGTTKHKRGTMVMT